MSLILEALRKSEAERRRGERPSLHGELPPAAPSLRTPVARHARWMLAAGAAALAGWGIYAWLPRHPTANTPIASMPATSRVVERAPASALPPVKHLTPPVLVAIPSVPAASPPASASPSSRIEAGIEPSVHLPASTPAPVPPPGVLADGTLRLSDLGPEERKALPPLKLSMHMWNDDAAQRFVILDGNRLREGDRIGDAVVTAITRDGVVLDWNGRRLMVPIR